MRRAGNVPLGIVFSRSHVDNAELRGSKLRAQFLRSCEQSFARVLFLHRFPIALVKMALQIKQTRFKFSMQLGVTAVLVSVVFYLRFHLPSRITGAQTVFSRGPLFPPRLQNRMVVLYRTLGSRERQTLRLSGDLFPFRRARSANGSGEAPLFTDLYMAHFALSDIAAKKIFFRERINRGYGDRAGALTDRYLVWNEDWKVEGDRKEASDSGQGSRHSTPAIADIAQAPGLAWPERTQPKRRGRRTGILLLFLDAHADRG